MTPKAHTHTHTHSTHPTPTRPDPPLAQVRSQVLDLLCVVVHGCFLEPLGLACCQQSIGMSAARLAHADHIQQGRAGQGRAGQGRAGQGRAGQGGAGQGR
jgi:hypothetical protein